MAQKKSVANTNISLFKKYYWRINERFIEGFTNKAAEHLKCIGKKESRKLWHIKINTLPHYGCILLIVNVQSSLLVEKQKPWGKPSKKSVTHTRFWISQCAQKSAAFGRNIGGHKFIILDHFHEHFLVTKNIFGGVSFVRFSWPHKKCDRIHVFWDCLKIDITWITFFGIAR